MKINFFKCARQQPYLSKSLISFGLVLVYHISSALYALPIGEKIIHGEVLVSHTSDSCFIQANGKTILHWEEFNVGSKEAVHFFQSQANQGILNRISGSASEILGVIQANCPVYLINPNGIFIGSSACIDTAGFIASTADLSNEAFLYGKELLFQDFGQGHVVNLGKIHADTGDVFLIACGIDNQGSIEAPNGIAVLATRELMLNPDTKQCIFIRVDGDTEEKEIQNSGLIRASAVELNTCGPYEKAIRHSGCIEALATLEEKGRIYLVAEGDLQGSTCVSGSLLAESGEIHVLGHQVRIEDGSYIDVSGPSGGTVLIGGDERNSSLDILHAYETTVVSGAKVAANGYVGDGGRIIVQSDGITQCSADLSSSALGERGDGGFIEVSGLEGVSLSSHPDLTSRNGTAGELLLDPGSITIQDGPNTAPPASLATVNDAWIEDQLQNFSSVSLSTADATNGAAETLTVNGDVSITWSSANNLTLIGRQNVVYGSGASIIATGTGAITIEGGLSTPIAGSYIGFDMNGGRLQTNSGDLTITGFSGPGGGIIHGIQMSNGATVQSDSGAILLEGTGQGSANGSRGILINSGDIISTGNASITLVGTGPSSSNTSSDGARLAGGSITSVDGPIQIMGSSQHASAIFCTNTSITSTGNATITLEGTSVNLFGIFFGTGASVTSTSGAIHFIGTGVNQPGISIESASSVSSIGSASITFEGSANRGGVRVTGAGSTITSVDGPIDITGTANPGTTSSNGIEILSAGKITSTGSASITLRGTASPASTTGSSGIIVNGTSSAVTSASGNINLTATGRGSGATNTGLRVSSAGRISSTSGAIQTVAPHAQGAAGTNNCYGIFVDGTASLITAATGLINLTGTGRGTGTTNQGIHLSNAGAITSTSTAPITLTGTGSSTGASSNEGIFITGSSSTITADSAQIQLIGTAGAGTTSAVTIDNGAVVTTSTSGDINTTATGGLSLLAGASGSARMTTTNGNIDVNASDALVLTGSTASNTFAQMTVGNVVNTVSITSLGASLSGGSGSGAFAEISTIGGLISIDGAGPMTLTGGSNTNTQAQIITLTNAIAGNAIQIGQTTPPTSLTFQGGSGGTLSRAVILSDQGGNILSTFSGGCTIIGGTSVDDARAGIYTGFTAGSGDITLSSSSYSLTGGASGAGINSAELMTSSGGGNIQLTATASGFLLQGGGGQTSPARIITVGTGNIAITGVSDFSALGGSGANSVGDVNANGTLTIGIGSGNFILTGGSGGTSSEARFTATGTVNLTGSDYTLTGGSSASANASNALIQSTGAGSSVTVNANNTGIVTLTGGTANAQHSYIQTTAGSGANPINLTCQALNLAGSTTATNASAEIATVQGDITIAATGNITLTGGSFSGATSLIQSTTQGNMDVTCTNLSVQNTNAVGDTGMLTTSGDVAITCTQDCVYAGSSVDPTIRSVLRTFGSNLTVTADGSITLSSSTLFSTPAPTGNLQLIAGTDITIGTGAQVVANGTVSSSLTLVVDNNYPTSPSAGPGQFILNTGGIISAGAGTPVKIYTSQRSQNSIQNTINGVAFIPGTISVNTATEQWGIYYSGGTYEGAAFKIYYKTPGSINPTPPPIPPPSPSPIYNNISANLVQLATLLPIFKPVLNVSFGHYHFQLCDQINGFACDPTFSPYGSFIFEDKVFWIGAEF